MSNVFISFLGTNNYLTCNYEHGSNQKCFRIKYVQEATIKFFCSNFTDEDKIIIFLTKEARLKNWVDNGHTEGKGVVRKSDEYDNSEGLKKRIKSLKIAAELIDVKIPEGFSEDEIWDIFNIVYNQINDNDNITVDITHAFRSIPMLGMVLLNYLKVTKNVKIKGIYYGAFEALGTIQAVKKKPIEERNVQILDLTPLHDLQQWSGAANSFIKFGNTQEIVDLLRKLFNAEKFDSKNNIKQLLRDFSCQLRKVSDSFSTVRGKEIIKGEAFSKLNNSIEQLKSKSNQRPLNPLLVKIQNKISKFKEDDILNGFHGVKWCIDHQLTQQGITLLQEMIITYLCNRFNKTYSNKADRELIATCLNTYKLKRSEWEINDENDIPFISEAHQDELFRKLADPYLKLPQFRNNINHAGFIGDFISTTFRKKLVECFNETKDIILNP